MDRNASFVGRLPASYLNAIGSSFSDFRASVGPDIGGTSGPEDLTDRAREAALDAPHGTTIVAGIYPGGVVMAGDRRATMGHMIASRDIEKVFHADDYSAIGIAGTAGIAIDMVRLFQVELEHYEKLEGARLSMDGKANRLGTMVRRNLGLTLQGIYAVPLLAGYDLETARGRIFNYDTVGGIYEEHPYYSIGSGSLFAKGALKKLWRDDFTEQDAVLCLLQALYDAADEDSGTGGPDVTRRIFPVVSVVSASGYRRLSDEEVGAHVDEMLGGRMRRPWGPGAPLRE